MGRGEREIPKKTHRPVALYESIPYRESNLARLCGKGALYPLRHRGPNGGRGGLVAGLLAAHLGKPGSIPGAVTPRLSHVGIILDDAAGRRLSRFPTKIRRTREPVPALSYNAPNHFDACVYNFEIGLPMGVIEVSMERRRNEGAGKTGASREDPLTSMTRPGIEPGSPWWEASRLTPQVPWPLMGTYAKANNIMCLNKNGTPLVIEVSMEQRRNARARGTGYRQGNPLTIDIVRHACVVGELSNYYTTTAPDGAGRFIMPVLEFWEQTCFS
ncbi:hypothetical protein PR048_032094 [Dryococelus australis]|uniref:Uncharacterized protein n=1 Tax=Dryococelus australis TaxID=614101 RepID=A0ABQ9G5D9_9NEOP|nr:hypothetical protein PR048_032094 [Dryococelus australis]